MNKHHKKSPIPYGRQDINQEDIDSVIEVLRSDFLTQGPLVPEFENRVKAYCGAEFATAVNSATSALHVSCLALDVGPGDIVWTSPNTFVASSNCALYCGASVDFVDINLETFNMSIESLEAKLLEAEKKSQLPKVVIPVHQSGQSCDMDSIFKLSKKYNFKIIEDASHGIGASFKDKKIGSCYYSDITVFSFHPVKIITSGEGGMAMTNNPEVDLKLKLFRSHGITSDRSQMLPRNLDELWNYQQIYLGFNYRMTDIHAALGISQLNRLDDFISSRRSTASRYDQLLEDLPLITPLQHPDSYSSYHLYLIRLDLESINKTQIDIYKELREKGVLVNLHYIPVYLQPYYESLGFNKGHCPNSEEYYKSVLSIPMYAALSEDDQNRVVETLREVLVK